jgi:hypothetical protein
LTGGHAWLRGAAPGPFGRTAAAKLVIFNCDGVLIDSEGHCQLVGLKSR